MPTKENYNNGHTLKFDQEFNLTFWPNYPVKNDKRNALVAFRKAREKTDLDTIMAGLRRYLEFLEVPSAPQPKYAQGWLNGERWNDELIPPKSSGHGPVTALKRAGEMALAVREEQRRRAEHAHHESSGPLLASDGERSISSVSHK